MFYLYFCFLDEWSNGVWEYEWILFVNLIYLSLVLFYWKGRIWMVLGSESVGVWYYLENWLWSKGMLVIDREVCE